MVSVCMATFNGSEFISDQVSSILSQLSHNDELLVSDDGSTDDTLSIIKTFNDPRIKIIQGAQKNSPALNFEKVLSHAKGDYIFLSDQDDIWLPGKVTECLKLLMKYDIVVTDCSVVDEKLELIEESFFGVMKSGPGLLKNFFKNTYLGCCMAFKSEILKVILPFPKNIPMHDIWIGFASEIIYKPVFLEKKLIKYRRHKNNVSTTTGPSSSFFFKQLSHRLVLLTNIPTILKRYYKTQIALKHPEAAL